jgi:hypothetical protein
MKKMLILLVITTMLSVETAYGSELNADSQDNTKTNIYPWCGQYCMSLFTKTRSANTVGKGHVSVSLKAQHFDWDQVKRTGGSYHSRTSGQEKQRWIATLCTKYGWAENHHIAIGIPYWYNDFDTSSPNDSQGLANAYVFEKWNFIKETNNIPAVAVDFWYYFPTGEADRKLGTDDGAYKITTEVSKAWKDFSLHFNPGYTWSEDDDVEVGEINGALLLRTYPTFWPAVEYNYLDKEHQGHSHDLVPGFIWKFAKGWSFKAGLPINIGSTFTDRDRCGIVLKLFRRW